MRGAGVAEAIDVWLSDEGRLLDAAMVRHAVPTGTALDDERQFWLRPDRGSVLITGTSGAASRPSQLRSVRSSPRVGSSSASSTRKAITAISVQR